jgi:hypothetical protein
MSLKMAKPFLIGSVLQSNLHDPVGDKPHRGFDAFLDDLRRQDGGQMFKGKGWRANCTL